MAKLKVVANNKKARHDYFIEETIEAGIALKGTEVKSIRAGSINLKEGYAEIKDGEAHLKGVHISPYEQGNIQNVDPIRSRKLLLHKREIRKLVGYIQLQGLTIIPLQVYFNQKGLVKVQLGIARGKKLHDKRQTMAKRDSDRRIQKELRHRQKSY